MGGAPYNEMAVGVGAVEGAPLGAEAAEEAPGAALSEPDAVGSGLGVGGPP